MIQRNNLTYQNFEKLCSEKVPPEGLNPLLLAMWYDFHGDWDTAHSIAQDIPNSDGSWIHAYLHRKEGDLSNASYWYSRAGKSKPDITLEQEWEQITRVLIDMY
jgi:hypothetical protein